ncbi:MAG: DUF2793 domain-containing protein [Henriciella sp.]|nr:DUF2793 domain-containing protein [Henriciella sp.]
MSSEDFSPNLSLPYLLPNQAQKHVTVNESLRAFDVLIMASVEEVGLDTPPPAPGEGQAWIVGSAPTDAWSGHASELVAWQDGAWMFQTPKAGWRVWDRLNGALVIFDGTDWTPLDTGSGSGGSGGIAETQNLEFLGLATTADAANPFAARLNSALWTAREVGDSGTGDLRVSLNKEAPGHTGSILFQSAYSGRAELGLVGTDAFSIRVSDDGTAWNEGLEFNRASGVLGVGGAPSGTNQLTVHGRLLVTSNAGTCTLHHKGRLQLTNAAGGPVYVQALSDGSILSLDVTDTTGVLHGEALALRPDELEVRTKFDITPETSASQDLGQSGRVWRDAYLQNAPTVASDVRGKIDVTDLGAAEQLIAALRPVSFRRPNRDTVHFGFIAQDVRRTLDGLGYDDVGLWTRADPDDAGSRQALRQEELIPVLVSAVQALSDRITALEQREGTN